jgi:two-component system OmpR family sensor kinase
LTTRLALWIAAIFLASMVVFGADVYVVVFLEERSELGRETTETAAELAGDVEEEVLEALAIAAPVGLLLAVGGAVWIARRTLAPMKDVMRVATEISAHKLDLRLPMPAVADEVSTLVTTLNALLARLEEGFAAQARFSADASHELRTPLAVIAGQLEVALARPRSAADWTETATTVLDEVRRLTRLGEALLRLRRPEVPPPGTSAPASAELASVVDAVASRSSQGHGRGSVSVVVGSLPTVSVRGDADELVAAVGNVVANAVRATPRGGTVRIRAEEDSDRVRLHVEDDGPGIAAADEERIFTPFFRGASSDGFGLGLTIARGVVEAVGGRLELVKTETGAHFVFTLPTSA